MNSHNLSPLKGKALKTFTGLGRSPFHLNKETMMKKAILALVFLLSVFAFEAHAVVKTQEIKYTVGENSYTGFLAYNDAVSGKRPGVLVVHEWWGLNAYARKRAELLAALGYTAFALDLYGTGKLADHPEDATKLMNAALGDLAEADKRIRAAYEILAKHETVDNKKMAAIGYCMGGGVVLHMARTGVVNLAGVVSFHGNLQLAKKAPASGSSKAKILVFTGGADPFVPTKQVQDFVEVLTTEGVEFELKSYPGVQHSFTNPEATAAGKRTKLPLVYNRAADTDSWNHMQDFFDDIFEERKAKS